MRFLSILAIFIFTLSVSAQEANGEWRDNLYIGLISSFYVDFVVSPVTYANREVGFKPDPDNPGQTIPNVLEVPYQTQSLSYFSFGIEPRYNLHEFSEELAVGISAPLTIGFAQSGQASELVNGVYGFGNFQLPLMAKAYLGAGSTSKSEEDFGISIGGGMELNKIAVIQLGASEEETNANRAWMMPSLSAAVHFYRGRSPMEVNVKYGFGKIQTLTTNSVGNPLSTGSRTTRANSLKLSFIYLIE